MTDNFYIQPFTDYFPQADIHELISPDILHQLIKRAFKDHIVTWIHDYIKAQHPENQANRILDDIDQQYVCSTGFAMMIY
jgi:hypothetical protein